MRILARILASAATMELIILASLWAFYSQDASRSNQDGQEQASGALERTS